MNYYISGQSGFIGRHITKYLMDKGHSTMRIQRGYSIRGLKLIFKHSETKPDYIIHLASYGNHYFQTDFEEMVYTNIMGTYNLLTAAQDSDYKMFYNFSSSSVILKHMTYYSITKLCAEKLVEKYERAVNIRPYSVYGIGEADHKFIPTVIRCLKTGELMVVNEGAIHDWIYIEDFIEALFAGKTEIGTGIGTTNKEIILMLQEISGKKLNYTTGKLRDYDNDNWVAPSGVKSISIYEGLKKVYDGQL